MAELTNPLDDPTSDDLKGIFNRMAYVNFNGVRREVKFTAGREVKIEHGLGFTPSLAHLTIRTHLAMADVGTVYMTRNPDDKYIYAAAPRSGNVYLEISHPPQGS